MSLFPQTRVSMFWKLRQSNEAWRLFFSIYGPVIYRLARHARLSTADAEEVVASVMSRLLKVVSRGFEPDPMKGRFRDYLRGIVRNVISDLRKAAAARSRAAAQTPAAAEPDADWDALERQEQLRSCIEKLRDLPDVRPRDFAAFERLVLAGEPAEVVAASVGLSTSRLYVVKHEMIKRLRQIYSQLFGDPDERKPAEPEKNG